MPRQLRTGQRAELYIVDVATGNKTLRYASRSILIEAPNWSPSGTRIAIVAYPIHLNPITRE